MALLGSPPSSPTTPGIHYFGPGGSGVSYPQPTPALPGGAIRGIPGAGQNPLVAALVAAAGGQPGQTGGFAQALHGLGDDEQGARLWEMRHPGVMGSPGHPGEGHIPAWVLQAQAQGVRQAVPAPGGEPSLANLLAAAAAAHPQQGSGYSQGLQYFPGGLQARGTRPMHPGGGVLPPQANQYPQFHHAAG